MAKYSPIAPIALLERMYDIDFCEGKQLLDNYLLLLAHDVLEHAQRYDELIHGLRQRYIKEGLFIIMDNSVVELGGALHTKDVIEAAKIVEASCMMTPDVLGDMNATINLIKKQGDILLSSKIPLMCVPQGENSSEIARCIKYLQKSLCMSMNGYSYWGVPRWITNKLGSRVTTIHCINMFVNAPQIHLLGMSQDLEDDIHCTTMYNVMGIDSANPVVLGTNGYDMRSSKSPPHMDRGNYWECTTLYPLAIRNVEFVYDAVKNKT